MDTEKYNDGVGSRQSPFSEPIPPGEFLVFSVFIVSLWSIRIGSTE